MKETITPQRKPRYFYGWNIIVASFLTQFSSAEQFPAMLGFFFKPLQQEFGWSRGAIAAVQSIGSTTQALIAPIVGPLIDRHGPRVLMPIGAIIVGLTMLGITQINAIWQFYLLRGVVVAIGFSLIGGLVISTTISNWFVRKRGRAIAISGMGATTGNLILSAIIVFVIAASGWRTMFVIFAIITWICVLIPSILIMRRRPEDMGLYPDGISPDAAQAESSRESPKESPVKVPTPNAEPIWSRREAMMTLSFWLLAVASAIQSSAFQSLNVSLIPYVQDLGYGDVMVASVATFRLTVKLIVQPFAGFAAEHASNRVVRASPFLIQSLGAFLFLRAQEPVFLWLATAVYMIGLTGAQVTEQVLWANFFGRLSLGRVRSLGSLVSFGLTAVGPIGMNLVFDILGSYRPAFVVITGLFAVSASLIGMARPPEARRYATAAELAAAPRTRRR